MITEELGTYLHGERIGALVHFDDDRMLFVFDASYAEQRNRDVLSLAYVDSSGNLIDDAKTTLRRTAPFFANLLPEGHLRAYLASKSGVNESRDYPLLTLLGRDLPGAIEMIVETSRSTSKAGQSLTDDPEHSTDDELLRFSLAGVQLKISAVLTAGGGLTIPVHGVGGDWIVKLPSATYSGMPQNEFSMLQLASLVGIDVPDSRLVLTSEIEGLPHDFTHNPTAEHESLAVRRFDRPKRGIKTHIEDFAQVFRLYPERKYERYGYVAIGRILATFAGEPAIDQFARRLAFSAMIGNADMHLKNWSLVYTDRKTPELSPAYDFVSTVGYLNDDSMALCLVPGVKKWNELTMPAFKSLAARIGVHQAGLIGPVRDTINRFMDVWRTEQRHLPISRSVATSINKQLKSVPVVAEARTLVS